MASLVRKCVKEKCVKCQIFAPFKKVGAPAFPGLSAPVNTILIADFH